MMKFLSSGQALKTNCTLENVHVCKESIHTFKIMFAYFKKGFVYLPKNILQKVFTRFKRSLVYQEYLYFLVISCALVQQPAPPPKTSERKRGKDISNIEHSIDS